MRFFVAAKFTTLLLFLILLPLFSSFSEMITLEYKQAPRVMGQKEYIKYKLPSSWNKHDTIFLAIFWRGSETPVYCNDPFKDNCVALFENYIAMPNLRDRIVYTSHAGMPDILKFFIVAFNATQNKLSNSLVSTLKQHRKFPTLYPEKADYALTLPKTVTLASNTPVPGDIFVDGDMGNDANSGLSLQTPLKSIPKAIDKFYLYYTTEQFRAGRTIWIVPRLNGNSYYSGDWRGEIPLAGKTGGTSDSPDTYARIRALKGVKGEQVRIFADGRYENGVDITGAKNWFISGIELFNDPKGLRNKRLLRLNGENLVLEKLFLHHAGKWGIQGMEYIKNVVIQNSAVIGTRDEHGLYFAHGSRRLSNGEYEPSQNIVVRNVISAFNGRHGIQFNSSGGQNNIFIGGSKLLFNTYAGLQITNPSGYVIQNNLIAYNQRQALVLFASLDGAYYHNGYTADPQNKNRHSLIEWYKTHFAAPLGNGLIRNNTFYVPERSWTIDSPHRGIDPSTMQSLWINVEGGVDEFNEPVIEPGGGHTVIANNIFYNQSSNSIGFGIDEAHRDFRQERLEEMFSFYNNVIFSKDSKAGIQQGYLGPVSEFDKFTKKYPDHYFNNIVNIEPQFLNIPPVPQVRYSSTQNYTPLIKWLNDFDLAISSSHSPAIDGAKIELPYNGQKAAFLLKDINGDFRGKGEGPDIGAFENF